MEEKQTITFTIKVMVEVSTQGVRLEWQGAPIASAQNATTTKPEPDFGRQPDGPDFGGLPDKLQSAEACKLWRKLHAAGYVDKHCRSLLSRTQSAIMAKAMADKLGIKRFWNLFSDLWKMKKLRQTHSKSLNSQTGWDFLQSLERIFKSCAEE